MKFSAICFGEVLWDVFRNHKKIGGAPLNVALRLHSFGVRTTMISKVGNDTLGSEIIDYVVDNEMDTSCIQRDHKFKTGQVNVFLNDNGSASYQIDYPAAWDKIEITTSIEQRSKSCDVFIFGSLICRDKTSKSTLSKLLTLAKFKAFDVNLRTPHYNHKIILELMKQSDLIKFNDEEILEICNHNNLKNNSLEGCMNSIAQLTHTRQICVTLGSQGAILFLDGEFYYHQGFEVKVVDTVGAGDSFLAALIYKLMLKENPQDAINFASVIGALVASKSGANPIIEDSEINTML